MVHVDAVVAPATGNAQEVKEGAVIKAVYVEQWVKSSADATTSNQFVMIIEKVVSNAVSITAAQILNIGAYVNKKNILYVTQGVIGDGTTQSIPIHRTWILIPKGKQRFGLGDRLVVTVGSIGFGMRSCGIATFKEFI